MSKMVSHPGKNTAVRVIAHERKRPARNATGPVQSTAQLTTDQLADNAFMAVPESGRDSPSVNGLVGEPAVNHLKASIGLLNRKRV